ncbi:MAG: hypothetical protein JW829_01230, partial [Pirellulales bacterium]|nr:hypothetical protein [Pirellulales bacterium]
MKIRFVLSLAMVCFVGANVSAALVDLNPVEDSYIRYNRADENYGTAGNLSIGQSTENNARKAYTLWDASSLNPADILSVDGIAFWSDKENTRSVALLLLAKDDGLDDNW